MIRRTDIVNAFKPSIAIKNPNEFAGRKDEIARLADSLRTTGSCPVIYGDRGLGKTSVANQMIRISLGDVTLLQDLGLEDRALEDDEQFTAVYVACSDQVKNTTGILKRLINEGESFFVPEDIGVQKMRETSKTRVTLKFLVTESETENAPEARFTSLSTEEQFLLVARKLVDKYGKPVLFVVDEVDRVDSTSGLANFIKNHSDEDVKFAIVGISKDVSQLLVDHESLARTMNAVQISRMSRTELGDIVKRAESRLADSGSSLRFADEAIEVMVDVAGGFPWFIHVLGQACLIKAHDAGKSLVDAGDVRQAIDTIAENEFAQEFNDLYTKAVGDSIQRETVLRLLAGWNADDVPQSDVYPMAKRLMVVNPSQYRRELLTKKRGMPIIESPSHSRCVRFRNAMFKRYIQIRRSIYNGVDRDVRDQLGH